LQEASRREALKQAGVAFGAAFVPAAANAAAGESPRFSVFGLIGEGDAMSEGAAYGTDQSKPLYSPYSVYSPSGQADTLYKPDNPEYAARSKARIAETAKRLAKIPSYVDKKKWFEVTTELDRYMYETRGAVRSLATTNEQKKAANAFFKAIEKTDIAARRRNGDECSAAATESMAKLDAFVASL
jgi:photosystem II oxygen-evolving enhancer protein 3